MDCYKSRKFNLYGAFLKRNDRIDLTYANLKGANLTCANLTCANLTYANLKDANLTYANLEGANLEGANLTCANLKGANLTYANLEGANLTCANLSGAKGLLRASDWIQEFLETTEDGVIAYKTFGWEYFPPNNWDIAEGNTIEEEPNPCRNTKCSCGVNVATLEWVKRYCVGRDIFKCLIRWIDLADVVVPYETDGKFRAARVTLLEKL